MQCYDTHLCLASTQPSVNITPALHSGFKPNNVVLLVSREMQDVASNLLDVYKKHGIKASTLKIPDAFNLPHIFNIIEQYLDNHSEENIGLNITGGTKPMALAAYEAFNLYDKPIFYVNTINDEVLSLSAGKDVSQYTLFNIDNKIKIDDYLMAYGIIVESKVNPHIQVPPASQELTQQLIEHIDHYKTALSTLNYYAAKAINTNFVQLGEEKKHKSFLKLLNLFETAGLLKQKNNKLIFKDEASRYFCNGGWLEDHVFLILRRLKESCAIQDMTKSLEVRMKNGSLNEIDIAFLAENRFHIIECKTKTFKRDAHQYSDASNMLYKLDTLKDYGGLQTRAMLISYYPLKEQTLNRARDYEIDNIDTEKIKNLEYYIKQWIRG
jgi:hypothetical protein